MREPIFKGTGVAMVTPFTESSVDLTALRTMARHYVDSGVQALIVCGTTGEASTMTAKERQEAVSAVVEEVNGQIPVIAGTGSNCTQTAIAHAKDAIAAGADALLVVTPYYNKASAKGLLLHYTAIADSVDRPLILYNVPSRTGVRCTPQLYQQLADHPNIAGVKEASGNLDLVRQTKAICPPDFFIWSGNDSDIASVMALGGIGVISVAANLVPESVVRLTDACLKSDLATASIEQLNLMPLCAALFREVNPIPVKTALAMMGKCKKIFRLPLCPMEQVEEEKLKFTMRGYHLL